MKILLCANDYPPDVGGIQTYSYQVAKNLAALGEEVTVLAPRLEGDRKFDGQQEFRTIRVDKKILLYPKFFWTLRKYRVEKILVAHRADYAALASWANRAWLLPYYPVIYGAEILIAGRKKRIHSSMERAKRIITISHFTRERLLELGIEEKEIEVIPPGVDSLRFRPDLDADAVLKKHHLFGRQVILTVSHLVRRKGHANVIRALPRVLEKVPEAIYLIVGRGPEDDNLRKLAQTLGILDRVVFAGFVSNEEIPLYYNVCQVFIMPSYEIKEEGDVEGFGIVFLEANACGKPVIGGRSGGVVDAVVDGETGLLVDPLNTEEISVALVKLLTDESLAERLGQRGRKRVEKELSWEKVTERILGVMKL